MKKLLTTLVLVCTLAAVGTAQSTAPAAPAATVVPDVIVSGYKAFLASGYAAAVAAWSANSPLAIDGATLAGISNVLLNESNLGGNFVGADVIRVVNLSASAELVYALTRYQHGMLFMSFTCYKPSPTDKWLVTVIDVDKDPAKILPTNILGGL